MLQRGAVYRVLSIGVLSLLLARCSGAGGGPSRSSPAGDSGGTSASGGSAGSSDGSGAGSNIDVEAGPGDGGEPPMVEPMEGGCGDGILQPSLGEACDDGNNAAGDGCSADCTVLEQGYVCLTPGMPCEYTVECGDSLISGAETCDDGDASPGDGCDASCQLESGWICPLPGSKCLAAQCGDHLVAGVEQCDDDDTTPAGGDGCDANCQLEPGYVCDTPGSKCRKAVCGDGVAEGGEPCDDPNNVVGDGCSPGCQAEPLCSKPVDADGCSSQCGDGLILPGDDEECDDGNKRSGDGCSDTCQIEDGYDCMLQEGPLPASIKIPFVFRDFIALPSATTTLQRHPDFQARCIGDQVDGMVQATLDADGKPVNADTCNLDADCTLDLGPIDQTAGHCTAHESCPGGYDACDQLHGEHELASHPGVDPFHFWYRDTDDVAKLRVINTTLNLTNGAYLFLNNNLFPFDNAGWMATDDEVAWDGGHNYGFTTEVRRWFTLNGGELLTFDGDDDVWVFINGKLALDMGGKHAAAVRTIRLDADGTVDCKLEEPDADTSFDALANCATPSRDLELVQGNVYEIALFHAERQTVSSKFRLALTGFVSQKSVCAPDCGDGVQTPDEDCDDGDANADGAYGGCSLTCTRGPFCGDTVLQTEHEECDDGKNAATYSLTGQAGCAPGCVLGAYCGDAQIDSVFGEECDDGTNAGGYGGCNPDCTLGPRCGDGTRDQPHEACDDGNSVGGDGCSAKCESEIPK